MPIVLIKTEKRAGEMAQQVEALAAKHRGLSSSPWAYVVEGESWLLQVVLCPPHIDK